VSFPSAASKSARKERGGRKNHGLLLKRSERKKKGRGHLQRRQERKGKGRGNSPKFGCLTRGKEKKGGKLPVLFRWGGGEGKGQTIIAISAQRKTGKRRGKKGIRL